MAHAMAVNLIEERSQDVFIRGSERFQEFLIDGVEGYVSICGHSNPEGSDIWRNEKGNVIICDC